MCRIIDLNQMKHSRIIVSLWEEKYREHSTRKWFYNKDTTYERTNIVGFQIKKTDNNYIMECDCKRELQIKFDKCKSETKWKFDKFMRRKYVIRVKMLKNPVEQYLQLNRKENVTNTLNKE